MHPAFSIIFLTTLIGAGQGLFLALVIISTQSRPCSSCNSLEETTRAGRYCLASFAWSGKGSLTTSPGLKAGIGFLVLFAMPFVECPDWVIRRYSRRGTGQDDPTIGNFVGEIIARFQAQRFPDRLRYRGLGFAGQLARNHAEMVNKSKEYPYCKENPYNYQFFDALVSGPTGFSNPRMYSRLCLENLM